MLVTTVRSSKQENIQCMQKPNSRITPKDIYALIRTDWHIKPNKAISFKLKLSEFGLRTADINLMLNSIEWKYNVKIEKETVLPQVTIDQFVKEVTSIATPIECAGSSRSAEAFN
jgi:hypothetical protein